MKKRIEQTLVVARIFSRSVVEWTLGSQVLESSYKILPLKQKTKIKLWILKGKDKEGVPIV